MCNVESLSLFISFVYLDFHVLGDDSLISYGSFMQTKHQVVLIHIKIKGEVGIGVTAYLAPPPPLLSSPLGASCSGMFILPPPNTSKKEYMIFCYFSVRF